MKYLEIISKKFYSSWEENNANYSKSAKIGTSVFSCQTVRHDRKLRVSLYIRILSDLISVVDCKWLAAEKINAKVFYIFPYEILKCWIKRFSGNYAKISKFLSIREGKGNGRSLFFDGLSFGFCLSNGEQGTEVYWEPCQSIVVVARRS